MKVTFKKPTRATLLIYLKPQISSRYQERYKISKANSTITSLCEITQKKGNLLFQRFSNDLPHAFVSRKKRRIEQETRNKQTLLDQCYNITTQLIIAPKFLAFPIGGHEEMQPRFNVIYSCLFIGRRYTCGCKRGERWRPAERESPDRGTTDEMAKKLEDFNDRTCSVQYDATQFNDVPVNPLLSTMGFDHFSPSEKTDLRLSKDERISQKRVTYFVLEFFNFSSRNGIEEI